MKRIFNLVIIANMLVHAASAIEVPFNNNNRALNIVMNGVNRANQDIRQFMQQPNIPNRNIVNNPQRNLDDSTRRELENIRTKIAPWTGSERFKKILCPTFGGVALGFFGNWITEEAPNLANQILTENMIQWSGNGIIYFGIACFTVGLFNKLREKHDFVQSQYKFIALMNKK